MTVYIDDMYKHRMGEFRGMRMSHMIADSEEELHHFARLVGLKRHWYQGDHYDVALSLRHRAVLLGAREITMRQLACMHSLRLAGYDMGDPETAIERRIALSRTREANDEVHERKEAGGFRHRNRPVPG